MSVLIKGMDMPKSCFYCPFRRKVTPDDIQCLVTREVFEETFTATIEMRNAKGNCPLIELPPHGDLIDRSKLAWTPIDITDLPYGECLPVYLKEDVDSAPIVIESEE